MSFERVVVKAPSNIALIKYMGKKNSELNIPENPSLSLTLNHLCTFAEIVEDNSSSKISWVPETPTCLKDNFLDHAGVRYSFKVPHLSAAGISRIQDHAEKVRKWIPDILKRFQLDLDTSALTLGMRLRTANTFPASAGIASSASSFAAVTLATSAACVAQHHRQKFRDLWSSEPGLKREIAKLSRKGSGSSCRSFEGPWVLWEDEAAYRLSGTEIPRLAHFVVLVQSGSKQVSSSSAHQLVRTSPLWEKRVERVQNRLAQMILGLKKGDLSAVSKLAWSEFWEMHSLFHTASEPFSYWSPETLRVVHQFAHWMKEDNAPIVTMDAGPNIHVLVPFFAREQWKQRLAEAFPEFALLEDEAGEGALLL